MSKYKNMYINFLEFMGAFLKISSPFHIWVGLWGLQPPKPYTCVHQWTQPLNTRIVVYFDNAAVFHENGLCLVQVHGGSGPDSNQIG